MSSRRIVIPSGSNPVHVSYGSGSGGGYASIQIGGTSTGRYGYDDTQHEHPVVLPIREQPRRHKQRRSHHDSDKGHKHRDKGRDRDSECYKDDERYRDEEHHQVNKEYQPEKRDVSSDRKTSAQSDFLTLAEGMAQQRAYVERIIEFFELVKQDSLPKVEGPDWRTTKRYWRSVLDLFDNANTNDLRSKRKLDEWWVGAVITFKRRLEERQKFKKANMSINDPSGAIFDKALSALKRELGKFPEEVAAFERNNGY